MAIAHGKGIIKAEQYTGSVNAEVCKQFVEDHFSDMFEKSANPIEKVFLQDGCPSQNSKLAENAWTAKGFHLFKLLDW